MSKYVKKGNKYTLEKTAMSIKDLNELMDIVADSVEELTADGMLDKWAKEHPEPDIAEYIRMTAIYTLALLDEKWTTKAEFDGLFRAEKWDYLTEKFGGMESLSGGGKNNSGVRNAHGDKMYNKKGGKGMTDKAKHYKRMEGLAAKALIREYLTNMNEGNNSKSLLPENVTQELHHSSLVPALVLSAKGQESKVQTPEEMEERTEWFFGMCVQYNFIPSWELYCNSLGWGISTINAWVRGRVRPPHKDFTGILQKAKDVIASYDANLVMSGKYHPTAYIFRSKNFYDMRDEQEVVHKSDTDLAYSDMTVDDLKEKYREATVINVESLDDSES